MKLYLMICFFMLALCDAYAVTDTTKYDRKGFYLGLEGTTLLEARGGLAIQGTYYSDNSHGFSLNFERITARFVDLIGAEFKLKYNRHIYQSFYLTGGGLYSNSTATGSMVFLVDEVFFQEIDVQQTYTLKGGLLGLGFFLPLPGLGALDMNFSLLMASEQTNGIDGLVSNATVAGSNGLGSLVRVNDTDMSTFVTLPVIDMSILIKF